MPSRTRSARRIPTRESPTSRGRRSGRATRCSFTGDPSRIAGFDAAASGPIGNGTGQLHNGSIDSLINFLVIFFGGVTTDQDRLDIVSFLFSFGVNTHAGVGEQVTVDANDTSPTSLRDQMAAVADSNAVGLVAKGVYRGERRGFA